MRFTVYTLSDPITKHVMYVGLTENKFSIRMAGHRRESITRPTVRKSQWISSLLAIGLDPIIEEVESVEADNWYKAHEVEVFWIHQFLTWGFPLTNMVNLSYTDPSRRDKIVQQSQKRVYQYNLDGSLVQSHLSARVAAQRTGTKYRMISQCCNNQKRKSTGGFMWSFELLENLQYIVTTKGTKVYQYSLSGEFIREWEKVQRAADAFGTHNSIIAAAARGGYGRKTACGYKWSYSKSENLQT